MHHVPYRSRLTVHKTPFGAAPAGAEITLRVVLPRDVGCRGVRLCWGDYDGAWETAANFAWERMEGHWEEWWICRLRIEAPGLYRYRFTYDSDGGGGIIGNEGGGAGRAGEGAYWQLTVYDPDFALPSWVPGGILYQIFPDRFNRENNSEFRIPNSALGEARDWGGEPRWEPDEKGRITQYDFFGGNLRGIHEKLAYLKSLGVTCIYLNPIFLARSNHRYDTADYFRIDPLLGGEDDFRALCADCHKAGIKILLDGVFSHTGADSVYFNKLGSFPEAGAYQSRDSKYFDWYTFERWPDGYASWWGIDILPELREDNEEVLEFFTGENGVARHWLRQGADGWRLDVADELLDVFLERLYRAALEEKPEAYLLGEVWEDASRKWSQGRRRRFLLGAQMHSVMNYPLAGAIIAFAKEGCAEPLAEVLMHQQEHYPPAAIHGLMNHIGTHDTVRILTRLGLDLDDEKAPPLRAPMQLTQSQYNLASAHLKLCAALQFTLPGNPCVYYGDEAGVAGGMDPYNRACYPWGHEDGDLLAHYRALGKLRRSHRAFSGAFELISATLGCIAFAREKEGDRVVVIANANSHGIQYRLPNGTDVDVPAVSAVFLEPGDTLIPVP